MAPRPRRFASDAGVGIVGFLLFIYGGIALALCWLVLRHGVFGARALGSDAPAGARRHWVVVPILLAAGVAVNALDHAHTPFFSRGRVSERALTGEAQRLLHMADSSRSRARRVGLFVVQQSQVVDGQVRVITASCGVIDSRGIVLRRAPSRSGGRKPPFRRCAGAGGTCTSVSESRSRHGQTGCRRRAERARFWPTSTGELACAVVYSSL